MTLIIFIKLISVDIVEVGINLTQIWNKECFELMLTNSRDSSKNQVKRPQAPNQNEGGRKNLSERMKKFWAEKEANLTS